MVSVRDKNNNTFSISKQDIRYKNKEVISLVLGKKHSDKTKALIKIKRKQQIITKQHRENISKGNAGKIRTDEAKTNYSLSKIGDKNPMTYRIWINNRTNETSIDKTIAIPIGWTKGRLSKSWITNGIDSALINLRVNDIPNGWRLGRTLR